MSVRAQILAKLADIENLLLEAECNGEQLAELDCFADVNDKLSSLEQAVDYYVD